MQQKTIHVSLKSFTYLGILVFSIGLFLILSNYFSLNPTENFQASNFTGGIMAMIFSIVLCYMGTKKRKIVFSDEKLEYIAAKTQFAASYSEINLIKTFIDPANKSQNLLIFVDESRILSVSSAFFPIEKIQEAYRELLLRCKHFIENNELTIDNELNW